MQDIFKEDHPKSVKEWLVAHQVGLLGTVIFHLLILIVVLLLKLNPVKNTDSSIFVEFQQPPVAMERNPQQMAEELLKQSKSQPAQSKGSDASQVRNVAVNSNLDKLTDKLVDDKYGKSNPVYEEARQLEERMRSNQALYKKAQEASKMPSQQQSQAGPRSSSEKAYRGASVLAYSVEGRQGTFLPVPAYLCEGGGDIVVDIVVNQKGYVTDASISSRTTGSECLFSEALKAARRSRFTMDAKVPASQRGSITYRFLAQ